MLHIKFDQDWPSGLRDIQVSSKKLWQNHRMSGQGKSSITPTFSKRGYNYYQIPFLSVLLLRDMVLGLKLPQFHMLCEQTAMALVWLRGCTCSPKPSLLAHVITVSNVPTQLQPVKQISRVFGDNFLYFSVKTCCGDILKEPCRGNSNGYPQHIFLEAIRIWIPSTCF